MKFSIITPSFRNSDWLRLCVASVADQGVEHEHIVQDAGSDDGTLEWLVDDKRVRTYVEKDAGMYDAINRGLRKATGEILAYLNCDEQYLPGALQAVERFFVQHPEVEMVFAHSVVVDAAGNYLFHQKAQTPLRPYTQVCRLATLTCGTFFRNRVIAQRGIYFDPEWRYCGDGIWMQALLDARVSMTVLDGFTSVFAHTGHNLSLEAQAIAEVERYRARAPLLTRAARPFITAHHRLRRLLGRAYAQAPFSFSLYTPESPTLRVTRRVAKPSGRWKW